MGLCAVLVRKCLPTYDKTLIDLFPFPDIDKQGVGSYFLRHTMCYLCLPVFDGICIFVCRVTNMYDAFFVGPSVLGLYCTGV